MYILAIDSSATIATAAVTKDGKCVASAALCAGLTHSQTLLPLVSQMLDGAGITARDIDLFACAVGPGSFTGVRIGVSMIKGLAFGTGKPCVAVSTIAALAENVGCLGAALRPRLIVSPVMDARRSQVYNALFRLGDGGLERLTPDRLITLEQLERELNELNAPVVFTGDGYELAVSKLTLDFVLPFPDAYRRQNAACVASLALRMYEAGEGVCDDAELSPVYLRPSQAERERLGIED